jgi:hypothetical protein
MPVRHAHPALVVFVLFASPVLAQLPEEIEEFDAPPLEDVYRFPTLEQAHHAWVFNSLYREQMEARRAFQRHRYDEITRALEEAAQLARAWDQVWIARCEGCSDRRRRLALKGLRELIGPEDYYAGRMPPPVPLWRFVEID